VSELLIKLNKIEIHRDVRKEKIVREIISHILQSKYSLVDMDDQRPWGAFFRLGNEDADSFVEEFFNDLTASEARLGNNDAELSPKILLVSPGNRLSWQYHERRAERWAFIHGGAYHKSETDEQGEVILAESKHEIQFSPGERHRLIGNIENYTVVAEIWQHTKPQHLSDESDIIRLHDDFGR